MTRIRARYTKNVGAEDHGLLVQDEAMGRAVNRPVLFLNHGKPARAEPENLNVLKPVDALQHQSFQLSSRERKRSPTLRPARMAIRGNARLTTAYMGRSTAANKGLNQNASTKVTQGRMITVNIGPMAWAKKYSMVFNIRDSDIEDIPLILIHQAGGRQQAENLIQADPHPGQEFIGSGMGDYAFHIAAGHDEKCGENHKSSKDPGGAVSHFGAGHKKQGAKAH